MNLNIFLRPRGKNIYPLFVVVVDFMTFLPQLCFRYFTNMESYSMENNLNGNKRVNIYDHVYE